MINLLRRYATVLALAGALVGCKTSQPISQPTVSAEKAEQDSVIKATQEALKAKESIPEWYVKPSPYNPERTKYFNLDNTLLKVSFDWEKQHLLGEATLTISPYFYAQDKVILDAKGFDIHTVKVSAKGKELSPKFEYNGKKLTIFLDQPYQKGEVLNVFINYTAKPNELTTIGSEAIVSDKGLYFINPTGTEPNKPQQIWTQGETESSSCWFPTFDAPNMKTKQEIYITVDKKYKTISNGKLISQQENGDGTRTDYWKQELPHAPYLFAMAIGEFARIDDSWKGKSVAYFVEPEYEKYAQQIFGNTPEMMTFYSELFKFEYPWDKYYQVVVRDFVSGAMENTSASIFMEALQVDDRYLVDQNWDFIIAHELIHHWFGDLVTSESWANLPLNESFANYGEYLWAEYKYGIDEANLHKEQELMNYLYEAREKQVPLIRYGYSDKEDMFDSHSYAKGGVILHMLRKIIGDEAFFESIHVYLTNKQYQDAEIHDLRLAFEQVTGQDLNWFFNQWFMKSGHPTVGVEQKYENGNLILTVKQTQDPKYTPIYRIPLKVDIWVNNQKRTEEITISTAEDVFKIALDTAPQLVVFDSERIIPGIVHHVKGIEELVLQSQKAEHIVHRLHAASALRQVLAQQDDIAKLYIKLMDDDAWAIREVVTGALEGYKGTLLTDIKSKVKDMAVNDPKSLVRATALETLTTIDPASINTVTTALNDSSYTVLSVALDKYVALGGSNPTELYYKYEDINDLNIIVTLANYYSERRVPEKLSWFDKKLKHISDRARGYLFNSVGGYAMTQPENIQAEAGKLLAVYAESSENYNTRIAAYQAMLVLSDNIEVAESIKQLAANEKHPQVLKALKEMGAL